MSDRVVRTTPTQRHRQLPAPRNNSIARRYGQGVASSDTPTALQPDLRGAGTSLITKVQARTEGAFGSLFSFGGSSVFKRDKMPFSGIRAQAGR